MSAVPVIEVDDLTVTYRGYPALFDPSFHVQDGKLDGNGLDPQEPGLRDGEGTRTVLAAAGAGDLVVNT